MRSFVELAVRRRVSVMMAALAVVVFGLVAYDRLALELFPDITYPSLTVQTEFPDTAPQEVEQIKQLEGILGIPLFEHMGRKIHLTEAGRAVLDSAQIIEHQLSDLKHSLADIQGLKGGTLTVSAASTASVFAARL
ncbi:MAG: efflux RND transporter permease subunit, partial [Candidatus Krumholzibacteriia bacterium]